MVLGPVVLALTLCGLLERRWPWRPATPDLARPAQDLALAMLEVALMTIAAPAGHLGAAMALRQAGDAPLALSPAWLAAALRALATDAAEQASHWQMRRIGPLWRLHRLHHGDELMDSATAFRSHHFE